MTSPVQPLPTGLRPQEKPKNTYEAKRLPALLAALQNKQVSGVLYLETEVRKQTRRSIFIFDQGRLIFGGEKIPKARDIATLLRNELGGEWTDLVLASRSDDQTDQPAPQAVLSRLVMMHLLSWDQVETTLLNQVAIQLELFLPYPGSFSFRAQPQPPIGPGFSLNQVMTAVSQRHSKWAELVPHIPSPEAIPSLSEKALQWLARTPQDASQSDLRMLKTLQRQIDGQHSFLELAALRKQDPLPMVAELLPAFHLGWLVCGQPETQEASDKPLILVVDDSPLMQQLIHRVLGERCQVLVASTAMEALAIMGREPVQLMLLDVSMPGIDGLELCRSIRKMSKFSTLPILMVTARDGFFDKVKGRMAGATEYLTKPFDSGHLRQVVCQYLSVPVSVA